MGLYFAAQNEKNDTTTSVSATQEARSPGISQLIETNGLTQENVARLDTQTFTNDQSLPFEPIDTTFTTPKVESSPSNPSEQSVSGGTSGAITPPEQTHQSSVESNVTAEQAVEDLTFDENPLNIFNSYIYHIKLELFSEDESQEPIYPEDSDNKIIIAETGISAAYYIESLEYDTVFGNSYNTISEHGNKKIVAPCPIVCSSFKIIIKEPLSFTFYDKLVLAKRKMKHGSWSNTRFFLTVSFMGWNGLGAAIDTEEEEPILVKHYSIFIGNVITDFDVLKGTTYEIDATMLPGGKDGVTNNSGGVNIELKTTTAINFTKPKTFKEALDHIAKQWSEDANKKLETETDIKNKKQKVTYNFVIHPNEKDGIDAAKWKLSTSKDEMSSVMTVSGNGIDQINIPAGSFTDYIVGQLLCCCSETTSKLLKLSEQSSGTKLTIKEKSDKIINTFNITSGRKMRKDGDITFTDVTFYINFPMSSHIAGNMITGGDQKDKTVPSILKRLNDEGILRKRYDYAFTGLNTEVINLDMNLKTFWTYIIPFLQLPLENSQVSSAVKSANPDILNPSNLVNVGITGGKGADPKLLYEFNPLCLEDLTDDNFNDINTHMVVGNNSDHLKWLVSGTNPSQNSVQQKRMSLFSHYYDQVSGKLNGSSVNESKIMMDIRGDPYWLGMTDIDLNGSKYNATSSPPKGDFNTLNTNPNFYLYFHPPQGFANIEGESADGLVEIDDNNSFNGFYWVAKIKNTFREGKLHQNLECYKNLFLGNINAKPEQPKPAESSPIPTPDNNTPKEAKPAPTPETKTPAPGSQTSSGIPSGFENSPRVAPLESRNLQDNVNLALSPKLERQGGSIMQAGPTVSNASRLGILY